MTRTTLRGLIVGLLAACCGPAVAQTSATGADTRLDAAISRLEPQRPGVVDAYVVTVALSSDPVFGREAREAARVFARRFDAGGRTLVLAQDEGGDRADAVATPLNLHMALSHAAKVMDRNEDVLVLYSTSHGRPQDGLLYQPAGETVSATIPPSGLSNRLRELGFRNRLIILQACYSGQFVPALANDTTIVITAAAADRSSFGCTPGNDWTFFGHALVNQAMRKPLPLKQQFVEAAAKIAGWEKKAGLPPSLPQLSVGSGAMRWLKALEAKAPRTAAAEVGRPPSEILD